MAQDIQEELRPTVLVGANGASSRTKRKRGFLRRFLGQPAGIVGMGLVSLLILMATLANIITPGDPFSISADILQPPSATHLFGTDDFGRDLFRAVVHGAQVSLLVGLVAAGSALLIGILIGGIAGFVGGWVDDLLMRVTELFMIIPRFFLILITVALLGSKLWVILLMLAITYWPGTARLLRAQVLTIRARDFVVVARALGVPETRILLRHVLPAALPPLITQAAFQAGGAILVEAGLSFLGLGDHNLVSWGALLNNAQQFVQQAWWMAAFPGLAITLAVLGLNLMADALNEALDPRFQTHKK